MDGTLTVLPKLQGQLSETDYISGSLSSNDLIVGVLTIPTYVDVGVYSGDYEVNPTFESQTLETKNKTLTDDILVNAIEVQSVSNLSGGRTVYIGGII